MRTIKNIIFFLIGVFFSYLLVIFLADNVFADTETTADVTEKSAGATHKCVRTNGSCTYDPRTDIWSDGGSDDDVIYWDQHGHLNDDNDEVSHGGIRDNSFSIMNDISAFMTEDQMLQGFTMDSSVGLRDRNYVGGDPFTIEIKVTDGTTTYSDTAEFTTSAGQAYQTVTSQLVVPENTLAYSLATFGLILDGASLTNGYNGPQTNVVNLTSTYELINNVQETVLDLVASAVDDIITDQGVSAVDTAQMNIAITTPSGAQTISVGVSSTPAAVTLSVPTVAGKIEAIQIDTGMAAADSQPEPVAEVAEAVAEVETAVEEKEETTETKADKAKAVQTIVTRVLQAVSMAGGDTDSTKLALMGILGTPGFRTYQQQEIPDVAFYDTTVAYESTSYIDPLGSVFSLGTDSMMNDLVDSQYK
tara:strand:- start:2484 stop:3737 length:1254 start_codon:yes stop_codon:yes gene_type:complete